jgi:hypothetical protein
VDEVQKVLFEYDPEAVELHVAGTIVTVVDALALTELEALFDTPHCGLYWYWPVPSTMSSTP